jgi:segregation and condensation protein B
MSLRPQLEAIIYAAETPISLDQISSLVKESVLAETPGVDAAEIKSRIRATLEELIADYSGAGHGIEIRQVAGGYRMSTKPEQHDVVRAFAKSLKLPTLLDRKLITTAGRKAVIGRPILYKTSKEFLLRFGLKDINELPSMEEFEKLLAESFQSDAIAGEGAPAEESLNLPLTAENDSSDAPAVEDVKDDSAETAAEDAAEIAEVPEPELVVEENVEETETPASTKPE